MKPCVKCTAQIPPTATHCNYCGAPQSGGSGSQPAIHPHQGQQQYQGQQHQAQGAPQSGQQQVFGPQAFANQNVSFGSPGSAPQAPAYPPQGGYQEVMTETVKPLAPPRPYAAAGSADLWTEQLVTQLLVFGILLAAVFVAPWSINGKHSVFAWNGLTGDGPILQKLYPLIIAATAAIAVVSGSLSLSSTGRGIAAVVAGLIPLVYGPVALENYEWRFLVTNIAPVLLITGLILRSRHDEHMVGKILATVGALAILALYLVPENEVMRLTALFDQLSDAPGKAKVTPIIGKAGLLYFLLTALGLLVWIPRGAKGLFAALTWLLLTHVLYSSLVTLVLGEKILDTLKIGLTVHLLMPIAAIAWEALLCFGLALLLRDGDA